MVEVGPYPKHDTGDCHRTAAPEVDPSGTSPGRFEGSPPWQSQTCRVWDRFTGTHLSHFKSQVHPSWTSTVKGHEKERHGSDGVSALGMCWGGNSNGPTIEPPTPSKRSPSLSPHRNGYGREAKRSRRRSGAARSRG